MNQYGIKFNLGSNIGGTLASASASDTGSIIKLFCDEAQLPNIQATTGQTTGIFLGEGQVNYAHTKMYSDFQLSWMCDANMTPLKFLNVWYGWIFQDLDTQNTPIVQRNGKVNLSELKGGSGSTGGNNTLRERSVRLNYPDTYLADIVVTKTERGKNAPNSRASMSYTMIDAFPYSIDAVPLSYGASQVTKVSANFYYAKHHIVYNDIRKFDG